jgi:chromate transporter
VLLFRDVFRKKPAAHSALQGTNAVVAGILLAAMYDRVWLTGIHDSTDSVNGLRAFSLLVFWKTPHGWVILAALAGVLLK